MNKHLNKNEEIPNDDPESEDKENDETLWSRDQRKRAYYYDDSSGYEIYNPNEEDEDENRLKQ